MLKAEEIIYRRIARLEDDAEKLRNMSLEERALSKLKHETIHDEILQIERQIEKLLARLPRHEPKKRNRKEKVPQLTPEQEARKKRILGEEQ